MEPNEYDSFDRVIRDFLVQNERDFKNGHTDNDWWYASSLGMCRRKNFFRRLNIPETGTKRTRDRVAAQEGNAGHEWREKAAHKMGVLIASEGSLRDPESRYSGRFDILALLRTKPVLVDIKTQKSKAFEFRAKKPLEKKIEQHQKMQLASYIYFIRKLKQCEITKADGTKVMFQIDCADELKEGRIYYCDRGEGVREEYAIEFNDSHFEKVVEELNFLNDHWADERFPKIAKRDWQCNFCPYAETCALVEAHGLVRVNDLKKLQ